MVEEKIKEIHYDFYNILNNWKLTINKAGTIITAVKLSYFVNLIKTIILNDCIINLLDYSCNAPSVYIPDKELSKLQYAFNKNDIETGNNENTRYGGKKTRKNINKKRKNNKIKKNKKKYKTYRRKYLFFPLYH
jgi:hypothetical protein